MSLPRLTNENLRKDLIQINYCEISIREGAFLLVQNEKTQSNTVAKHDGNRFWLLFYYLFSEGRWHCELQAKAFIPDANVVHFPLLAMWKEVILLSRSCPLNSR